MKVPKIIGVAGTNGAGKDTLGELLAERCGYKFVSVSDILRAELTKRGVPHEREHMRALSTDWAREYGPGVLSLKTIEAYLAEEATQGYAGLAIGSIRRPDEVKAVHDEGGLVVWVDADRRVRYERLQAAARGRSEDVLGFDEWAAQEDVEMTPLQGDPNALNMAGVRELADITVINEFDSTDAYRAHLIEFFEL